MARESYGTLTGLLLLLGGLTVMSGWLARWPVWDSLFPTTLVMVFNTALSLALAGWGLALRGLNITSAARIRSVLGLCICAVAAATLVEGLFSIDLGLDWHSQHQWFADKNPVPGRMA